MSNVNFENEVSLIGMQLSTVGLACVVVYSESSECKRDIQ